MQRWEVLGPGVRLRLPLLDCPRAQCHVGNLPSCAVTQYMISPHVGTQPSLRLYGAELDLKVLTKAEAHLASASRQCSYLGCAVPWPVCFWPSVGGSQRTHAAPWLEPHRTFHLKCKKIFTPLRKTAAVQVPVWAPSGLSPPQLPQPWLLATWRSPVWGTFPSPTH